MLIAAFLDRMVSDRPMLKVEMSQIKTFGDNIGHFIDDKQASVLQNHMLKNPPTFTTPEI